MNWIKELKNEGTNALILIFTKTIKKTNKKEKYLLTKKLRDGKIKKRCALGDSLNTYGWVAKRLNAADCKSAP